MSEGKLLLKNTIIYSVGTIGSKIISFALLPLYSFFLTKSELGEYDIILTTVTLLVPLMSLEISRGAYRWLLDSEYNYSYEYVKKIISNSLYLTIFVSVLGSVGIVILNVYSPISYVCYFMTILILSICGNYLQNISRGLKKNKIYVYGGLFSSFSILIFTLLFVVVFGLSIVGVLLSLILGQLISVSYMFVALKMWKYVSLKEANRNLTLQMIKFSLPLVPHTVSWWVINASSRFLILLFISIEANGIFAVSARFPSIIYIFNSIFLLAWQDQLLTQKDNKEFSNLVLNKYIILQLSLCLPLVMLSKPIVSGIISADFYESWKYMGILFISAAFSGLANYFEAVLIKEKKTKFILISTVIGGIITLLISFLFIRAYSLWAISVSVAFGYIVTFFVRLFLSRTYIDLKAINWSNMIMLILLTIVFLLFSLFIENNIVYACGIAASCLLFVFYNLFFIGKMYAYALNKFVKKNKNTD